MVWQRWLLWFTWGGGGTVAECRHVTVSYAEGEWRCENPSCREEFVQVGEDRG